MIAMVRIDDRLIHGQVVEGWVNFLKATCIFVAEDAVASNALQRSIMEMSVPQGLKVIICTVEEITSRLRTADLDAERSIVLFARPADVARAMRAGMACPELNIGGMHFIPGKQKYMDVLALNAEDLEAFSEISGSGVKIIVQAVPTQRPTPLDKVLQAESGSGKKAG